MNDTLLGKARMLEFLCTNRYQEAEAANKAAHDAGQSLPHSQADMLDWQIEMLWAQLELAKADCEQEDNGP